MLIPHSTNITGSEVLALLESLIPTLGLDPAQEIGVRSAIDELRDLTDGDGLDAQLETAREIQRAECEDDHAAEVKTLKEEHAEQLVEACQEARDVGHAAGIIDSESVIVKLLTPRGFGEYFDEENEDFATMVEDEREAREHREAVAERERLERAEQARISALSRSRYTSRKKAGSK